MSATAESEAITLAVVNDVNVVQSLFTGHIPRWLHDSLTYSQYQNLEH